MSVEKLVKRDYQIINWKNHGSGALGVALCLTGAGLATWLGRVYPVVGSVVFALVGGIILRKVWQVVFHRREASPSVGAQFMEKGLARGTSFTSKYILQLAIIFLGFQLNLAMVFSLGAQSLLILLSTITASLATGAVLARVLGIRGNAAILIAVGTSICGGSAIAATAPVLQAKEGEVAQAISTIFLFNLLAVFFFPGLGHLLGMSDAGFGVWAGTAINDTSSVVAAGSVWSEQAGNSHALEVATVVKLTRTLMIIPISLLLAFWVGRGKATGLAVGRKNIFRIMPWFVFGFLGTAGIATLSCLPLEFVTAMVGMGKLMIVMAMVAIGWKTDLPALVSRGWQPLALGMGCWGAVAGVAILLQLVFGMW